VAESCDKAFGRYLRTLRERRQLTLDDVASLSNTFPDSTSKGYLSRCENGHQKPAFSKVIALSRIYEVPADVLVERMELDMELDRVGGPETAEMSFSELLDAGRRALQEGYRWDGYGYLRDAVIRAPADPVRSAYANMDEQKTMSVQHVGTAARALGRHRFALHEFLFVDSVDKLSPRLRALLHERIACSYASMNEFESAASYANRAIEEAEGCDDHSWIGHIYNTRAIIALQDSDPKFAVNYCHKAYKAHKLSGQEIECALTLTNLSQCYYNLKRYKAARRASEASLRLASLHNQERVRALNLIMLGDLHHEQDEPRQAEQHWREASAVAKKLRDRELRFKADFALYKRAIRADEPAVARAIRRRLLKLVPWLPKEIGELAEFQALTIPSNTDR